MRRCLNGLLRWATADGEDGSKVTKRDRKRLRPKISSRGSQASRLNCISNKRERTDAGISVSEKKLEFPRFESAGPLFSSLNFSVERERDNAAFFFFSFGEARRA